LPIKYFVIGGIVMPIIEAISNFFKTAKTKSKEQEQKGWAAVQQMIEEHGFKDKFANTRSQVALPPTDSGKRKSLIP